MSSPVCWNSSSAYTLGALGEAVKVRNSSVTVAREPPVTV